MAELKRYWAAVFEARDFIPRCLERHAFAMSLLDRSGRTKRMTSMLSAYYGMGTDGTRSVEELRDAGEDGEVTELHTNQVAPVITNALSLIAGQRLEVKAHAMNEDSSTLAQTRLAEQLLEVYDTNTGTQEREVECVRGGLLASSWWMGQAWRPKDGKEWARDEKGEPLYEGDVAEFVLAPWHVAADNSATNDAERKWVLFKQPASRYDLAAQFDVAEGAEVDPMEAERRRVIANKIRQTTGSTANRGSAVPKPYDAKTSAESGSSMLDALLGDMRNPEDVVWVWEMRHLKTPALPKGRLIRFIEPDIVLWDSMEEDVEYPYEQLHMFEFCPERTVVGGAGHSSAFNLGGLQELIDICTASMASTVNINGQNSFWQPDTDAPQLQVLANNATAVISKVKPEVLEFAALKPEVLQLSEWAVSNMRQSMALNDVVMGAPPKGMPAQAQALQRAQAQQYHAVAQAERVRLRKQNANGKLQLLKRFARSPRTTKLAGKARTYEVKEWQSTDIQDADTVTVEMVDPVFASFEGRQSVFEALLGLGTFQGRPDAALTFLQTGSLAAITSTQTAQRELVEANVALLQRGIGPPEVDMQASMPSPENPNGAPIFIEPPEGVEVLRILKSDPHHLAIQAYLGVLSSPGGRADAKLMKATTEAIQLSLEYWAQLTPDESAIYGIPPLPSQMMMAAPPMGGAPSEGAPVGGDESVDPSPQNEQGIKLPRPPPNPLDGSQESSGAVGLTQ